MIIFLASNNAHKAAELRELIGSSGVSADLRSAREIGGMPDVVEDAPDFAGNARLKARALLDRLPSPAAWSLADDSGIEVDALGGAPGIHSARYAGRHGDDAANNRKLLAALAEVPPAERTARFRCVLVLRRADGAEAVFDASCEGHIALGETGENGFGYDPLFIPLGESASFGVLSPAVKSRLSHRSKAVARMIAWMRAGGA